MDYIGWLSGAVFVLGILVFVFIVVVLVSYCKVYTKAGEKWWAAIVPFYNFYILFKIVRQPISIFWAWMALIVISFIHLPSVIEGVISLVLMVAGIWLTYHLAKAFGKGIGFTIGMVILPFIFYPILGFGKSSYQYNSEPVVPTPPPAPNPSPVV